MNNGTIHTNLLNTIQHHAKNKPNHTAFIFIHNNVEQKITFSELYKEMKQRSIKLLSIVRPGDKVILLNYPGLEFIKNFLTCLYSAVIAVPVSPVYKSHDIQRIYKISENSGALIVLSDQNTLDRLYFYQDEYLNKLNIQILKTNTSEVLEKPMKYNNIAGGNIAFLQYTSGSTGDPKGVIVKHDNIMHNMKMIQESFGHNKDTIMAGWLPFFHDMGLIGKVLQPLYLGITCILMPPSSFLKKPLRWLEVISKYSATTSGAPNFAYDMCVDRIKPSSINPDLDLSSWKVAFNGSEVVRADTINRFSEKFKEYGFRKEAFFPCYGLAEATLFVCGADVNKTPTTVSVDQKSLSNKKVLESISKKDATVLMSSGKAASEIKVIIVEPSDRCILSDNEIGEVWMLSKSVAAGYWNRKGETVKTFQNFTADGQGPYFRTGDLGFMRNSEIYITGRLKNLIIIRGKNYYPEDIERVITNELHEIKEGCCVAFGFSKQQDEDLVIVGEINKKAIKEIDTLLTKEKIKRLMSDKYNLYAKNILLIETGQISKTSSGKLRRYVYKDLYTKNRLVEVRK